MAEEGEGGRFVHLLSAPVRDLTHNWSIDIASELTSYLSELEGLNTLVDPSNSHSFNFAEAALLIQGTTTVYSKKVEYLHQLVIDAFQSVSKKKQKELRKEQRNKNAPDNEDDAEQIFQQDEERFLSLDDSAIVESDNINLNDSNDDADLDVLIASDPNADADGDDSFPSFQCLHLGDGTDEGALAITSCAVHDSGALLLEPRDQDVLDSNLNRIQSQPNSTKRNHGADDIDMGEDLPSTVAGEDDAGDVQAPGPPPVEENDIAPPPPSPPPAEYENDPGIAHEQQQQKKEGPTTRGKGEEAAADHQDDQEPDEPAFDPWEPIDFDDPDAIPIKPLKKGKPWRELSYASIAHRDDLQNNTHKGVGEVPEAPNTLGQLVFPEFAYILEEKKKGSHRRRNKRAVADGDGDGRFVHAQASATGPAPAFEPEPAGADELDEDNDAMLEHAHPPDDDDGPPPISPPMEDNDNDDDGAGMQPLDANQLAQDVDDNAESFEQATAEHVREQTFGERCKAHVDECINAAAAAEVQTEMSKRVSDWSERIRPRIEEQEKRCAFDIEELSDEVLERVGSAGLSECSFKQLASGSHRWSVCQTFAAVLQLATNGCVTLQHESDSDGVQSDFSLVREAKCESRACDDQGASMEQNQQQQEQQQQQQSSNYKKKKGNSSGGSKRHRKPLARLKGDVNTDDDNGRPE